jgi:hypothetical protein
MAKPPVKKKASAKKTPRPAKDLKPGDSRASYLKKATEKKAKPPSGTLTDRMGEAKSRPNKGLPAKIDKSRGNLNRANPPKEIRLGGQGGTGRSLTRAAYLDKFKPVPLGNRPALLSGPKAKGGGSLSRAALGLPALVASFALSPSTFSYKTGGAAGVRGESDNPSGKLFSPSQNRAAGKGNPKTVNPYKKRKDVVGRNPNEGVGVPSAKARIPSRGEARGGMKATQDAYRAEKAGKTSVSMSGGGVNNPTVNASEFKKKNLEANQKVGKKVMAPKSTAKAPKAPSFKGNWTGATPSEMQKRGGQRIKRPNLLSLFRGKR